MKNFWLVAVALFSAASISINTKAQTVDPYRVVFSKPLQFETHTKLTANKIKIKVEDGTWQPVKNHEHIFNCDAQVKIEGRDLAIKNKGIGEHYYGSMNFNCENIKGQKFATTFGRVLFLGIRNCIQSETVFDKDYCSLDVIAMRKEKDLSLGNGDLIKQTSRIKKYYAIHSAAAYDYVNDKALIPEGLQVNTIDSYQIFKLTLGRQAQDFFIEKPDERSNFMRGQNIYLKASDDVLIADQKTSTDIEGSYNRIMQKLSQIPNGEAGVKEFEKQLPSILIELAQTLKKLLTIITPVEFVRSEAKLKTLEKEILVMANAFKPTILNRDDFKRQYAALSDEYNRYSNYLSSNVQFKPSSSMPTNPPVVVTPPEVNPLEGITRTSNIPAAIMMEYFFEKKTILPGENEFFDQFVQASCMGRVVDKVEEFIAKNTRVGLLKDKMIREKKIKHAWLVVDFDDTREEIAKCHNVQVAFFLSYLDGQGKPGTKRLTDDKFRINPEDSLNNPNASAEQLMKGFNESVIYSALLNLGF